MYKSPALTLHAGSWLALRRRDRWEYVTRTRGKAVVGIVALTDARELVLVEQYRAPFDAPCIELPAGLVGDDERFADETLLASARRELVEETGYSAEHWRLLYTGASSSGLTDELVTLYLATGLHKVGIGGGDWTEQITVHLAPLDGLEDWLAVHEQRGIFADIKLFGAAALVRSLLR